MFIFFMMSKQYFSFFIFYIDSSGVSDLWNKFHGHRLVLFVFIPLIDLEIGERGGTARTVWDDAVGLVDESFFVDLRKYPPNGFHKLGIHSLVIMIHIDPTPHPLDGLSPDVRISEHIRTTPFIEFIYPDFLFYILFPGDIHLLLDDILDRETVTVPPEPSLNILALHRLIPWDHILDRPRKQVTIVRSPGRKRRSVIEIELRSPLADRERLLECIICLPIRERLAFESRE